MAVLCGGVAMNKVRAEAYVLNGKPTGFDRDAFLNGYKQFEGQNIIMTYFKKPDKRSIHQNAFMWGHVYKVISDHTGFRPEEVHNYFRDRFLPLRKRVAVDPTTGERVVHQELESTTKLSVKQFTDYLDQIMQFSIQELECNFDDAATWCEEHPEEVERYQ